MKKTQRRISNNKSTKRYQKWREDAMNKLKSMRKMHNQSLNGELKEKELYSNLDHSQIRMIYLLKFLKNLSMIKQETR